MTDTAQELFGVSMNDELRARLRSRHHLLEIQRRFARETPLSWSDRFDPDHILAQLDRDDARDREQEVQRSRQPHRRFVRWLSNREIRIAWLAQTESWCLSKVRGA